MKEEWGDFRVTETHIFNYGDQNMHAAISGYLGYDTKLNGLGHRIYRIADGSIAEEKVPVNSTSYLDGVKNMMFRLHFGDYAGYGLRIISFCYFNVSRKKGYVDVGFWSSAHLSVHLDKMVTEGRKVMRSLRYHNLNDIDAEVFVDVIQDAETVNHKGFWK
jgi:hypothetical protein